MSNGVDNGKKVLNVPNLRFKDFKDFWTKIKVNEIGKIATGTTPSTKETHFYGGNFLWVTPTDINGKEVLSTTKKLTLAGLNNGRKIPKNSVLATCIASIGKNCILREDGSCNQQINAITPSNDFNVDFVYYLICKNEFQMHANAGHGGMEILNKESFGNLLVNVPNICEQIKISDFLSLIDKRIDTQNKIIEELNVLRNSIIDNFYRKKTNGSYKPVSGMINEFCKKTTRNNEYEVLSSTANGIYKQSEYFNKEAASADTTGYKIIPFGHCTYRSMSDTGEFHFNQQLLISKGIVSPAYPVFTIIEKHSKYVLVSLNDSPTVKKQILADKSGGTRFALPLSRLRKILIPWADDKDIFCFEELVSKIDSKLTTEKHIASKLLKQKNYLLANLFI